MLSRNSISELLRYRRGPCVSLFTPTRRRGTDAKQNVVCLDGLIRSLKGDLAAQRVPRDTVADVLRTVPLLREQFGATRCPDASLACFMAPEYARVEQVPVALAAQYSIGDRFSFKPLLPLLAQNRRFFVLALSHDAGRMFEATADCMCEVSLEERYPAEPLPAGAGGRWSVAPLVRAGTHIAAAYHQRPTGTVPEKADVPRFLRIVDHRVRALLEGQEAPLVLACIGFLAGLYQSINSYRHLLPAKIPGNPMTWSESQLHRKAYEIAEPFLRRRRDAACQKYEAVRDTALASRDLRDIAAAADAGKVDTLLLTPGAASAGCYHKRHDDGSVDCRDNELADVALAKTLLHGGSVYDLDRGQLPGAGGLVAVYRFSA